jgi:hypothetical protein
VLVMIWVLDIRRFIVVHSGIIDLNSIRDGSERRRTSARKGVCIRLA